MQFQKALENILQDLEKITDMKQKEFNDEYFLQCAIKEAKKSETNLKVGAIVVKKNKIIAKGHRQNRFNDDRSFHAEELF